jgi:hypothetical protein
MTADDQQAWLRVAAKELAHLPPDILADACAKARRTCTHHGQIVPAIIKESADWIALRKNAARNSEPVEALPKPDRWVPEPGELERIKAEAAANLRVNAAPR